MLKSTIKVFKDSVIVRARRTSAICGPRKFLGAYLYQIALKIMLLLVNNLAKKFKTDEILAALARYS